MGIRNSQDADGAISSDADTTILVRYCLIPRPPVDSHVGVTANYTSKDDALTLLYTYVLWWNCDIDDCERGK